MKLVLISGSSRKDSQSLKITTWLDRQLKKLDIETEVVDLQQLALPVQHEEIWDEITSLPAAVELRETLESADGFVVVSPEWHGMASPALKNMFLYVNKTMAHKPALLTTVSAARGGAYPIAELRISSYKNSYLTYIPEQLVIRDVNDIFNSDEINEDENADQYMKKRAIHSLKLLVEYAKALQSVRQSGVPDYKTYPNGM
jgi:NAD(P)H-dependent FMN reductase